ncbi:MAG: V-type ATP synthase subunit D [Lachnospiraceae bacterium]|nr:V-type ATP synthase subunit D [Lachnospiraceae bacterium]
MASSQVIPTRMELGKQKKRLVTAVRGHKLLKDKRDELMRQFLELVRENKTLRESVEEKLKKANANFVLARAAGSDQILNTALLAPKQQVFLDMTVKNVMSVEVPVFEKKTRTENEGDIYSYGYAFTPPQLDDAVESLYEVLPELLRLAEVEKSCRLMAAEIEKTRRRVNALEHVIIPDAQTKIKFITMKLDENERSTQIRLMKIQDMMVAEAIEKAKAQGL